LIDAVAKTEDHHDLREEVYKGVACPQQHYIVQAIGVSNEVVNYAGDLELCYSYEKEPKLF
jgi:hypothetical protein